MPFVDESSRGTQDGTAIPTGENRPPDPVGPLDLLFLRTGQPAPPDCLIVQKFGGSSVADAEGIRRAARRVAETRAAGYNVVVVVSAMGDTTDELLELAAKVSPLPRPKELDALLTTGEMVSMALLALALADLGFKSKTFTGVEAGLITDHLHGKAHIIDVEPHKVRAALKHGEIAIVAGFQGRTRKKKVVTTLGRGGSDLTAVALAASLGASVCEIYTDVDGVYTADPRVVPTARKIDVISSEEMLELAASGAKILHLRCVEYARRFGLPIHVRSSFVPKTGTLILPALDQGHGFEPPMEQPVVSSVSGADSAAKITVAGISSMPGATAEIFEALAASGLHIDMIAQNSRPCAVDIVFTLPTVQAPDALEVLNAVRTGIGFEVLEHEDHVGKVTVSGLGMRSSPEVLSIFLKTLSDARVDTGLISTSETCITAVMRADQLEEAVSALREAFHLSRQRREVPTLS